MKEIKRVLCENTASTTGFCFVLSSKAFTIFKLKNCNNNENNICYIKGYRQDELNCEGGEAKGFCFVVATVCSN